MFKYDRKILNPKTASTEWASPFTPKFSNWINPSSFLPKNILFGPNHQKDAIDLSNNIHTAVQKHASQISELPSERNRKFRSVSKCYCSATKILRN